MFDDISFKKQDWGISFAEEKAKSATDFDKRIKAFIESKVEVIDSMNFSVPKKGECLYYLTSRVYNLFDVLDWYIRNIGEPKKALFCFYTTSVEIVKRMNDYANRFECDIIVSDLMNTTREKELKLLSRLKHDFTFMHNHTKTICVDFGDEKITITGTLNSGNNARFENCIIFNGENIYNFTRKTMLDFAKEYAIPKRAKGYD